VPSRGRPLKPLDPDASEAARLGYEIRSRRIERELTQAAFGAAIGYSVQQVSGVELAKAPPSAGFVAACERVLEAEGAFERLLPAVLHEAAMRRQERSSARAEMSPALRLAGPHHDAGEDVDPTTRRGLLDAGAVAALGGVGVAASTAAPAAAREVDPDLPGHWTDLLGLLSRYDDVFGPRAVRDIVRRELGRIAEHRQVARGELRTHLLRVEAQWAEFAAFLAADADDVRRRDAWTDRALWLAKEAVDADMIACVRMRRGQWAADQYDARGAIASGEEALRVSGTSGQTRARCALRAAFAHALAGDAPACQRHLADAEHLVGPADSAMPAWVPPATPMEVRVVEARCWLTLAPHNAIPLYETALRDWPATRLRARGVHQARLAIACAQTGEIDRAKAEGRRALAITKSTKSATATRELRRLRDVLQAA
jgi:transcriptional regulator with XRE-family HTH domain